ncbi:SNF2 family N-terminal domain-containing protein [Mycena galopus ATCC 62051]|nr:SNF2 family N-terminal domain-containing protein [Mycena galopus ATCC 62051]
MAMDPERFISLRAPVFILDENEATKLAKGDPVKISPEPDHWMSRDQPTPALIVRSNDSELAIGALTSYHNAPKLYLWMDTDDRHMITIAATVAESTGRGSPEPLLAVNIEIYGPPKFFDLYMCRMLWAISDPVMRTLYKLENAPKNLPPCGRGGLLADDMGLGKTLTMLALIAVTKNQKVPSFAQTTLIVAPLSVLSVWEKEIESRCPSLKYQTYYPADRRPQSKPLNFVEYDIVITNYNTLQRQDSPLKMVSWRRVILDEAHNIRNDKAKTHKAVVALKAHARWALTGTPIVNTLHDIRSLLAFLKLCQPLAEAKHWKACIGSGSEQNLSRHQQQQFTDNLKKLLKCVCLHRTKEMRDQNGDKVVSLPKVTYQTIAVTFDSGQQSVYDNVAMSAKQHIEKDLTKLKSRSIPRSKIVTIILRLRQAVMHPALVPAEYWTPLDREDMEVLNSRHDHLSKLTRCSFCFETMSEEDQEFIRRCTVHANLRNVLAFVVSFDPENLRSPMLQGAEFDAETSVAEKQDSDSAPDPSVVNKFKSAKLDALIALLHQTPPDEKCLVFSTFVGFLEIAERRLWEEKIEYVMFHGKMSGNERKDSIAKFCDGDLATDVSAPRVMLLSLQAGGVGLNLNVANHVFLMDPWWQPSMERQAIDRVNRIGQTREVNVFRLVATAYSNFQRWIETGDRTELFLEALGI